jgi:hypothetical protein
MFHFFGLGFVVCLALYFLPTIIGWHKRNAGAIFVLNLLLGWTLVGWVVALVWALTSDAPAYMANAVRPPGWCCACASLAAPRRPGRRRDHIQTLSTGTPFLHRSQDAASL